MTEKEYNDLKEKFLKAPNTQISQSFKDRLKLIKFGESQLLREWIEDAIKNPCEVSNFAVNSIGFGLYNPMMKLTK